MSAIVQLNFVVFFNCFTFVCAQTGVKILCPYEHVSLCLHVCVCMVSVCACDVCVCTGS